MDYKKSFVPHFMTIVVKIQLGLKWWTDQYHHTWIHNASVSKNTVTVWYLLPKTDVFGEDEYSMLKCVYAINADSHPHNECQFKNSSWPLLLEKEKVCIL